MTERIPINNATARAYRDAAYRSWSQEQDQDDPVGVARTALREALRPADA